jgi:hypothetical protein
VSHLNETYLLVRYFLCLFIDLRLEVVAILFIVYLENLLLQRLIEQISWSVSVTTPLFAHFIDLRLESTLLLLVLLLKQLLLPLYSLFKP